MFPAGRGGRRAKAENEKYLSELELSRECHNRPETGFKK
jgi:hypothetical protein